MLALVLLLGFVLGLGLVIYRRGIRLVLTLWSVLALVLVSVLVLVLALVLLLMVRVSVGVSNIKRDSLMLHRYAR